MLKKLKLGGFMLASLMVVASCQNEEIVQSQGTQGQSFQLVASRGIQSRTDIVDGANGKKQTVWSAGDKIYVSSKDGRTTGVLTLSSEAGSTSGTFTGFVFGNPDDLAYSVYPAPTNGTTLDLSEVIGGKQVNAPMIGKINKDEDVNVQFNHTCGVLYVNLEGASSYTVSATNSTDNGSTETAISLAAKASIGANSIIWDDKDDDGEDEPYLNFANTDNTTITISQATGGVMYIPFFINNTQGLTGVTFTANGISMNDTPIDLSEGIIGKVVMNGIKPITYIGETTVPSLQSAIDAVEEGGTVVVENSISVTEGKNGINVTGGKSFTLDLGGNTFEATTSNAALCININNDEVTAPVTINIKNGKIIANSSAYCALIVAGKSAEIPLTVNLEDVELEGENSNGSVMKVFANSIVNVNAGTKITGKNSYGCMEVMGTVNIYDGAEFYQQGTSSYVGCLVGVSTNGVANVYGGYGKSAKCGLIVMTSGGTINAMGGEWIANTDGTVANDNNSVLIAQSDKNNYSGAGNSVVNVTGGTFKGGYNCYGNTTGDAQLIISGGNFNADPSAYVASGYIITDNEDDTYTVSPKISQSTDDVASAITSGDKNVTLAKDMTLDSDILKDADDLTINLKANTTVTVASGAMGGSNGSIKNFTFAGDESTTVKFENTNPGYEGPLAYHDNANLTFKGVTFNASEISGICARGGIVIFEDCIITGELEKTIASKFVFSGCTFDVGVTQVGYGCSNVAFEDCTFETEGYGIKIYSEGSTPVSLNVTGCSFENTNNAAKSAIFLDHIIDGITYNITVDNCSFKGYTATPTPNENKWAARMIVEDSFVQTADGQYIFSYQTGAEDGNYHKILTADQLVVTVK